MNSTPSSVTIKSLREHFRTTYNFNEEQINLMVVSSARSIQAAFLAFDVILDGDDVHEKLVAIAHGLKGLLLNMGQNEWAGYVREMGYAASAGEDRDYKEMMQSLRLGLREVCRIPAGRDA